MIVGLCGYAGAGKDSVARILVEDFGFERRAFADALKAVAYDSIPNIAEAVDVMGWDEAKQLSGVRQRLQDLGVACRTHIHEDVWVDAVLPLEPWAYDDIDIVITDVRFDNEIKRIHLLGGAIGEVRRPGYGPVNAHVSEAEWVKRRPEFDFLIMNNGDINSLAVEIRAAHALEFDSPSDRMILRHG